MTQPWTLQDDFTLTWSRKSFQGIEGACQYGAASIVADVVEQLTAGWDGKQPIWVHLVHELELSKDPMPAGSWWVWDIETDEDPDDPQFLHERPTMRWVWHTSPIELEGWDPEPCERPWEETVLRLLGLPTDPALVEMDEDEPMFGVVPS